MEYKELLYYLRNDSEKQNPNKLARILSMIQKECNHNHHHFVVLFCRKSEANFQLQLCFYSQFILSQMEGDNMCKHSQSN